MSYVTESAVTMPLLALRGLVVFPKTIASFDVARKKSIKAVNAAMESNRLLFLTTQKDFYVEEPNEKDLYKVGCVVKIKQVLKVSDSLVKVLVEGICRATFQNFRNGREFLIAEVTESVEKPSKLSEIQKETYLRKIKADFSKYASLIHGIAPDVVMAVDTASDLSYICDFIAFNIPAPIDDKQYILEQISLKKKCEILLDLIRKESAIGLIDRKISEKTKAAIDENQKEYYLREQIKIISEELYGDDANEIDTYYSKISNLSADDSVKEKLNSHVQKLSKMPQGSHEGTVERGYLDTCLELPWNAYTKVSTDIKRAAKILDRDIYGMKTVKERILELLSVYAMSPDIKGQIICLVGPPGVGKTSIGKSIAECMSRQYARVSLGGIHDEAEIRGHRKTYIGAMPGKIINAVRQAGSSNPLILLDEIDKLGNDYKGDPSAALLEVLDPEQNSTFVDHFVEIPYDLSRVVFIATANTLDTIPSALMDRMEIIEISSYTREEKFQIAKKHLVAKQLSHHGLNKNKLRITDDAIYSLIDFYTREAGVRRLERSIASLCRKAAKILAMGEQNRVIVKADDVVKMLGRHKYNPEVILENNEVGIINGLAWTSVGGEIMQLEVSAMPGTGKIELTGSLGDVMKESARAAVSYVRANAQKFQIDSDFYKTQDIHIHATEAAVPKDGPSAGVTITTALVSALTNSPVLRDVAMTGEVTIRGRVLKIGGLKEKSMAAYRGGVKTVFIPKDNVADLDEVDDIVKENINFVPVSFVDEIIEKSLVFSSKCEDNGEWKMGADIIAKKPVSVIRQ